MTRKLSALALAAVLGACATAPGPQTSTLAVMPGPYKPFEVFERDRRDCEDYASMRIAGGVEKANQDIVASGLLGTALGALVGATKPGRDRTTEGAVVGGVAGTAVGASIASRERLSLQQVFDLSYAQCMYARGNQVPGYAPAGTPPPPPPRR